MSSGSTSQQQPASAAATATPPPKLTSPLSNSPSRATVLAQQQEKDMQRMLGVLPKEDEVWSAFYTEAHDAFADFASHDTAQAGGNTPTRQLSARQISGQFEDDVAKEWEEDWEDEDVDDSYDSIMASIVTSRAKSSPAPQLSS